MDETGHPPGTGGGGGGVAFFFVIADAVCFFCAAAADVAGLFFLPMTMTSATDLMRVSPSGGALLPAFAAAAVRAREIGVFALPADEAVVVAAVALPMADGSG